MSALIFPMLAPLPIPRFQRIGLRAQLERAERALDGPFDKRRSLELDRLVLRFEQVQRRARPRILRRAA